MDNQNSLPENVKNTVRYELYLSKVPDKLTVQRFRERLRPILKDMSDNFQLELNETNRSCFGSYDVNQSIELEWLIIYALYDLSRFDRDLVITIQDSDGQILLITAAEEIPKWLESSKSKNRVFIHQGKLHIIPEEINLKDLKKNHNHTGGSVTLAAACFIREMNHTSQASTNSVRVKTVASQPIQAAIEEQLAGMPDQGAWLSRKFKQVDEIFSGQEGMDDKEQLQKKFDQDISLASVMAMDDEDLKISPISSRSSSITRSSSSSSWLTEQEND